MEHSGSCIACLVTSRGPLHIFNNSALVAVLEHLPTSTTISSADHEGFTAKEWADFARKKSAIASKVSRLNGKMKSLLAASRVGDIVPGVDVRSLPLTKPPAATSDFAWSESCENSDHNVGEALENDLSVVDCLFVNDPWRSASGCFAYDQVPARTPRESNGKAAWARWRDTLAGCAQEESDKFDLNGAAISTATVTTCEGNHLKGDWRALPEDTFANLYKKFPCNPSRTAPDEYVQQRWPSNRPLLGAARHLRRYGYSATLPDDIHYAVDKGELLSLREVFKHACGAKAKHWNC